MKNPCKKGSRAFDIFESLMTEKTIPEVIDEIVMKRETEKRSNIVNQVNTIIRELKKGRWEGLTLTENNGRYKITEVN